MVTLTPLPLQKDKSLDQSLVKILEHLRQHQPDLVEAYGVRSLGVFGSYVQGDAKPDSDLDILVAYHKPPTLFEFVGLQRQLSQILNIRVDLVMKTALKPKIGKRILAEVVLV